ncbi:MAG TPA: oligopeptide transporter, OPT family [Bryobacteraceae bacterium]|nr:oligopeptide transporter, OPT family [Bryobacteraceae bacterium]
MNRVDPMADITSKPPIADEAPQHRPYVPNTVKMTELTAPAVLIGLVLSVVLGFANAYLGLRAGITIAATYPAAVIGMALLRLTKGSILEENLARTAGSIGESVAAGAIFTLPAFVISRAWGDFSPQTAYWKSTVLMLTGSVLGVLFVSLMRRVMVEDRELPFPESTAAAEIHKAGQAGAQSAKYLFGAMGFGGFLYFLGQLRLFPTDKDFPITVGELGHTGVRVGPPGTTNVVDAGGVSLLSAPSVSPAYLGVGYIIGPRLASLNFAGGVFAWGLMVPLLIYFLGPRLQQFIPAGAGEAGWEAMANAVWRFIVRPIAVGGMLVGAAYTLFRMRKSIAAGLGRAISEVTGRAAAPSATLGRTEQYMSSKIVFAGIALVTVAMAGVYIYFSGQVLAGLVATLVMLVVGFFFATVSGSLVGFIGSTNNPISGLTLSTLIIAALLMVALGISGPSGVAAILGVAAVVCVSSAVAGELLQDFKVGYILGGTPRTIQLVELVAVVLSSLVMYFPLLILHQGNINAGGTGFGDRQLSAPQAGLMASIAQGIIGGDMPWPLVVTGMALGIALIMVQVKSPMLFAVGMYLPFATTFAIFVGGLVKWLSDTIRDRQNFNEAQKARIENIGILVASGLIAGEAMVGLIVATCNFFEIKLPAIFENPPLILGVVAMAVILFAMFRIPLANPGRPDEPAPPTAIM